MENFTELVDLAAERLGGAALLASDDFFAPKENLLRASEPIFRDGEYTERGKWMDGWESRRRRTPGHDWCVVRLGLAGIVRGVVVDTSFFRGNFPESCSIEGCAADANVPPEVLASPQTKWTELLPRSALRGDSKNAFAVQVPWTFTHLRLNIFPDGGVARLRVHGMVMPDWKRIARRDVELDLAALAHGSKLVATNDRFFGSASNMLMPGTSTHMGDGWETRRRRTPGHDWAIVRLAMRGRVQRVELDTTHFKGNYPDAASLEACSAPDATPEQLSGGDVEWRELLPKRKLQAHTTHVFDSDLARLDETTHVRLSIYPDGGVARLRLFGLASAEGRASAVLCGLNALAPEPFESEMLACCGSSAWARAMASARPFETLERIESTSDRIASELGRDDWLEAFARHPQIGERAGSGATRAWSEQEQSGARAASAAMSAELARVNAEYHKKFGYIFIVCATGKSVDEMLAAAKSRLSNAPDVELRNAAGEQQKITRLRLAKLFEGS